MRTEALKKAQASYAKAKTTTLSIKLTNSTDADILDFLAAQDNKQGAIKAALREHIARIGK